MGMKQRLRSWLGIISQANQISYLQEELDARRRRHEHTERRHLSVRREVEELGLLARATRDLLGPIWKTAEGHSAPMAFLSTSHLSNILAGGFGSPEVRQFAELEVARRTVDADWRAREAGGERAPTRKEMMADLLPAIMAGVRADRENLEATRRETITFPGLYSNVDFAKMERRALLDAMFSNMEMVRDLLAEED